MNFLFAPFIEATFEMIAYVVWEFGVLAVSSILGRRRESARLACCLTAICVGAIVGVWLLYGWLFAP